MNDDRHAAPRRADGPADIHADETGAGVPHVPSKTVLRAGLLAARADRSGEERHAAARALAEWLAAVPEIAAARVAAAYVPVGSEPGPPDLPELLRGLGCRVLLPVLLPDNDLDWAEYTGPESLHRAGRGLHEPAGPRLGPGAVAEADAVVVPGLAVDGGGMRLGRGGGSYDRALARVRPEAFTVVLLHDGETVAEVPAEPHDRPVRAALTPGGGLMRFGS